MIIYKITNKINGKIYIGQTKQKLKNRWSKHVSSKTCKALGAAIRKYGKESFDLEILKNCSSYEEMNILEKKFIQEYSSLYPNGYNLTTGGNNGSHVEETKRKISEANKGHKNFMFGKKASEETRRKQSEAHKNRPAPTKETRKKLSENAKRMWQEKDHGALLALKRGARLYVLELDMCFFSASCLAEYLGVESKRSSSGILGSIYRGYKYQKKYTVIPVSWSENRKNEHIKKCSTDILEKQRNAYAWKILDKSTNIVYPSTAQADRDLGFCDGTVRHCLRSKNGIYKTHVFVKV